MEKLSKAKKVAREEKQRDQKLEELVRAPDGQKPEPNPISIDCQNPWKRE